MASRKARCRTSVRFASYGLRSLARSSLVPERPTRSEMAEAQGAAQNWSVAPRCCSAGAVPRALAHADGGGRARGGGAAEDTCFRN
eukprot:1084836-Pleurochrysis_carterae.AAC.1